MIERHRSYQYDFSKRLPGAVYNHAARERKAKTILAVLEEFFGNSISDLSLLDVGCSTGIISHFLSNYFRSVIGIDIDTNAINFAIKNFKKSNLYYLQGNSMQMSFPDRTFDVITCIQVYEHVPDAKQLANEIHRVLKPGGVCYFAAGNRLNIKEPHYNLPLLSIVPRPLAHRYIKAAGKGDYYYEKHFSYWGLKNLIKNFKVIDYTKKMIYSPYSYHVDYMLPLESKKARFAKWVVKYAYCLCPGYIWLLQKE